MLLALMHSPKALPLLCLPQLLPACQCLQLFALKSSANERTSAHQESQMQQRESMPQEQTSASDRQNWCLPGTRPWLSSCYFAIPRFSSILVETPFSGGFHPQLTFPLRKYSFLHFLSRKTTCIQIPLSEPPAGGPQLRCLEGACPGKGPSFWQGWQYWLESWVWNIENLWQWVWWVHLYHGNWWIKSEVFLSFCFYFQRICLLAHQ